MSTTYIAIARHAGDVTSRREFDSLDAAKSYMEAERASRYFSSGLISRRAEDGTMLPFDSRLQYRGTRWPGVGPAHVGNRVYP